MGDGTREKPKSIDERQLRCERGLVAVLLFGGYVWQRDLVIPAVAVGITAALVPAIGLRPFGVPFERLIAPRLRAVTRRVPLTLARSDDLILAAVLMVATLLIVIGLGTIARVVGLVTAGTAMLEAAAGLWVGAPLANSLRGRSRPRP